MTRVTLLATLALARASIILDPNLQLVYSNKNVGGDNDAWAALGPGNEMCASSVPNQSPIDLPISEAAKDNCEVVGKLPVKYNTVATTNLGLTGNGVELEAKGEFFQFDYLGETYLSEQFHFHSPSEHVYDGIYCPGEVHVVANNIDPVKLAAGGRGAHAVISICMQMAVESHSVADALLASALPYDLEEVPPGWKSPDITDINLSDKQLSSILEGSYYSYVGSYTTPSCTAGIDWLIMAKPLHTEVHVIEYMQGLFLNPANHRSLQPIGDRKIKYNQVCKDNAPNPARNLLFANVEPGPECSC